MRALTSLGLLGALLLGGNCKAPEPETRWEDHAVLTWAEKLSDSDPWVRAGAADALGRLGPEAIDASGVLLNRFREDESAEVRARCARALGQVGALSAKDALLAAFLGGEETRVRASAAEALVLLGAGAELQALLLAALDARAHGEDLQATANGFAALGASCVEPLRERLATPAPGDARTSVALCLGAVGEAARPAVPDLVTLLEESEDRLRLAAIIALGSIGGPEACRALAVTVEHDPSPSLQLEALIAGAQSCNFQPVTAEATGSEATQDPGE